METRCNIEPHPRPPLFLPVASLFLEKKLSVRESQASSPTLAAAARLAAMIHGKDRMYTNNMKVNPVSFFFYAVDLKIPPTQATNESFSVSGGCI